MSWIGLSGFFYNPPPTLLPLTTDKCPNSSIFASTTLRPDQIIETTNENEINEVTEILLDTSTLSNITSSLTESEE